MKLRRNCFSPTWRIKNSHVEIYESLRGYRVLSRLAKIFYP